MSEEQTETKTEAQPKQPEPPRTEQPVGRPNLVEQAKLQNDRHEALNKETKVLADRLEALKAQEMLGGQAEAGQEPKKEEEISDAEYADKAIAGEFDGKGKK